MPEAPEPALLQELEERAVEFAQGAGRILLEFFRRPLEVQFKGQGKEPVTEADRRAQEYLLSAIARAYPGHALLGEEDTQAEAPGADFLWAVDPLDGTTNFVNGLPIFAVSVGVLHRGRPVAGCIFAPGGLWGGAFHARRGGGAYLDGQPISVLGEGSPVPGKLASLPAHYLHYLRPSLPLRRQMGEVRSLGSVSCEMALVACGTLQYALFGLPRVWDVAAGALLVQEAGGEVLARGRRGWQPLEAFTPPPGQGGLRRWAQPLIVGNGQIARFVATNLRRRQGLLGRLASLARG